MVELIFKNLLYVILFVSASTFVGLGTLRLLRLKVAQSYSGVFKIILIGFFLIVTLFAVIASRGATVLLGFVLVGLFLWWDSRFQNALSSAEDIKQSISLSFILRRLLELSIVSLIIILYRVSFMDAGGYFIEPVYNDYVFYAKLSKYLLETGIENVEFDYIFLQDNLEPYHYVDIWINSILVYVTRQNAVELMILSSYTIGLAGIWLGMLALLETWFGANLYSKIAALLLIFATGIFWGGIIKIPFLQSTDVFARHGMNYSKLFPIYWIILLTILLYRESKTFRSKSIVTALLALPIINISSAPGVFFVLCLFFLIELFKTSFLKWEIAIKATVIVLFIGLFYKTGQSDAGGSWSFDYKEYIAFSYIKTFINVIAGTSIQMVLLYLPIVLILPLSVKHYGFKTVRDILLATMGVFFAFIIPWAVFHRNANSVQLFSNTFIPFITCFFIAIGCDMVSSLNNKMQRNVIAVTMLLLPALGLVKDIIERTRSAYSISTTADSVADCVDFFSKKVKNPVGVYFSSDTDWATKAMPFGALDMKFQQFVNRERFHTISLSILDIPLDTSSLHFANEREQIKNALFYRYLEKQPKRSQNTITYFQEKFVKDFNVEYVLTNYTYSLPPSIRQHLELLYDMPSMNLKVYSVVKME